MAGARAGRHRYLHGTSVHWPLFRGRRARDPTFPRRNPVRGVEGSAHFADDEVEAQGSGAVPETTQRGRGRPGAKAVPSCATAWRERGRTRSTCDPAFPAPAPRPPACSRSPRGRPAARCRSEKGGPQRPLLEPSWPGHRGLLRGRQHTRLPLHTRDPSESLPWGAGGGRECAAGPGGLSRQEQPRRQRGLSRLHQRELSAAPRGVPLLPAVSPASEPSRTAHSFNSHAAPRLGGTQAQPPPVARWA